MAGGGARLPDDFVPAEGSSVTSATANLRRRDGTVVETAQVPVQVTREAPPQEQRMVVHPTPGDVSRFGMLASERLCGNCRYFNLEAGQREAHRQRFWARLRHEHGWQGGAAWTGPVPNYGICEHYGDAMVFVLASADPGPDGDDGCEYWRPGYGRIIRSYVRKLIGV